jgi:uncharacterized membrane protein YdjX (TVP38/TMEM64 family)
MKKSVVTGLVVLAGLLILFVAVFLLLRPFIANLSLSAYRDRFVAWIEGLGIRGAAILLGLQALQIIVAIIPGGPVELLAGAAYGTWGGFAICILGCLIASSVIFMTVKAFGLPLVERILGKKLTDKYKFLGDPKKVSMALAFLFILFLIPGVPKDALTYIAPLGPVKQGRFLLISTVARAPAILMSTMLGSSALQGNWALIVLLFAVIALMGVIGLLYGGRITEKIKHKHYSQDN